MGENSGQIGTKDISKNYPNPSDPGIGADQYHIGRQINLIPQEGSIVSRKQKDVC